MPEQIRKDLDLRTSTSGDPCWIVFAVRDPSLRPLSPGHAFVGFAKEDASQQQSWLEGFGLVPDPSAPTASILKFGAVSGQVQAEQNILADLVLSCRIHQSQFDNLVAIRDRWISNISQYRLIFQDCVSFVLEIADAVGLIIPSRETIPDQIQLPITHIRRLLQLNDNESHMFGSWYGSGFRLIVNRSSSEIHQDRPRFPPFPKVAEFSRVAERSFRLQRVNDREIIRNVYGERPPLLDQLEQMGIRPSIWNVERIGPDRLVGSWQGPSWSFDGQGRVQITQPENNRPQRIELLRQP